VNPKRVVSVSLGSSTRDVRVETELLGERIVLERRGTDGDMARAAALIEELDGTIDAFGLGGIDLFVQVGERKYHFRQAQRLARQARTTPVVCGAGLKNTLERRVIERLDEPIGWCGRRVLMVAGVDRFGMSEALAAAGADLLFGDMIFVLGVPMPVRSLTGLGRLASVLAPIVTKLPIAWLYPTGEQQETERSAGRGARHFAWAEVIAGDFHFVRRYAPLDLTGKIVLTNTTTSDDVDLLRERGVRTLITTTPRFDGRSLSTNLLEAAFVALAGRHPLTADDYRSLLDRSGLEPNVLDLNATS
jgi:hypothetical protein